MPADIFDRRTAPQPTGTPAPDPAFAARPRLVRLRDALRRAAKQHRPSRWNEPAAFFFDPKRQAELEAARPEAPDRFAELAALIATEMSELVASAEVRRVARAVPGLKEAATALASRCAVAKELAELLAIPDDEVFLAVAPAERAGVRLHVRGVADVAQLMRLLAPALPVASFQLFAQSALQPDGTLPVGFAGAAQWLWPTQPLAAVPRINGERVVLVGPAVVKHVTEVEPRFPALAVECEVVQSLNAFQTADVLSRLCGRAVPVQGPSAVVPIARAA